MTKKAIAMFLLLALALSLLVSCQSDGGDKDPLRTVEVTNRYRVVSFEAPEGYTADRPYAIGGKIYIRYYQGNYDGEQKNLLYVYDQTGAVVDRIEIIAANADKLPYTLIPSDDGAYYTVDKLKIRKVRYDGTPIFEVGLSEAFGFTDSVSDAQLLHHEGLLFFMLRVSNITSTTGNSVNVKNYDCLLVMTEDGEAVGKLEYREGMTAAKLFLSPDGSLMFHSSVGSTQFRSRKYYTVNTETWKAEEAAMPALPADANGLSRAGAPDLFYDASFSAAYSGYYSNDVGLYGYGNAETSELLVDWTNSDLLGENCEVLSVLSPDTVLVMLKEVNKLFGTISRGTEKVPALLIRESEEEAQRRTVLTLAIPVIEGKSFLYQMAVNFNRSSDQYRIVIENYTRFNSDSDFRLGEKRFDIDLASGVVYDLVSLSDQNRDKYVKKGMLADLYEFFDADGTLSRESLLGCVRQGSETDGKLYVVPWNFYLYTVVGKTALVGDREMLTVSDLRELQKKLPSDARLFSVDRFGVFRMTIEAAMSEYIDYPTASCRFTDPAFVELLEFLKALPETGGGYFTISLDEDGLDEIRGERTYLLGFSLLSIQQFIMLKNIYRDDAYTIKGYPNNTGNGSIRGNLGNIAIPEKSAQKEGAWEFLKYVLSDEVQTVQQDLPVTNSGLSALLDEYLTKHFYTLKKRQTTSVMITDEPRDENDEYYEELSFTREDADEIIRFLNGLSFSMKFDQTALEIILEEVIDYFGGTRNAKQCAENIQNRVSIYLSEQN